MIQLMGCTGMEALSQPPPSPAQCKDGVVFPALGSSCGTMVLLMTSAPQKLLLQGQILLQGPNVPSQGQILLSWSQILISPQYSSSGQLPGVQQKRPQLLPWLQCGMSLQEHQHTLHPATTNWACLAPCSLHGCQQSGANFLWMWGSSKALSQQSLLQRADLQLLAANRDVSAWWAGLPLVTDGGAQLSSWFVRVLPDTFIGGHLL